MCRNSKYNFHSVISLKIKFHREFLCTFLRIAAAARIEPKYLKQIFCFPPYFIAYLLFFKKPNLFISILFIFPLKLPISAQSSHLNSKKVRIRSEKTSIRFMEISSIHELWKSWTFFMLFSSIFEISDKPVSISSTFFF